VTVVVTLFQVKCVLSYFGLFRLDLIIIYCVTLTLEIHAHIHCETKYACLVLDVTVGNTDQFSKFTVTFDTKFVARP